MRGVRSFSRYAVPLTLLAGCGVQREPVATLDHVAPTTAYSDATTAVSLLGGPFRPPLEVDTQSGAAEVGKSRFAVFLAANAGPGRPPVPALDPQWRSTEEIDARVPEGLPAGDYTVQMTDPRGEAVPSQVVFRSLGPDLDPPSITFARPDSDQAFGGGEKVSVIVYVNDGAGNLRAVAWSTHSGSPDEAFGDCTIDEHQPKEMQCNFSFTATASDPMANLKPIDIRVDAWDSVGNHTIAVRRIRVAWSPTITSVFPPAGPTIGGTAVRVDGAGFISGLSQILIDGTPIGGQVSADGMTIDGTTGPHVPGVVSLTVGNGGSLSLESRFEFISPPRLREVSPRHGAPDAWTQVTLVGNHFRPETIFSFRGQDGLEHPVVPDMLPDPLPSTPFVQYQNDTRVLVTLPPGMGVISIIATDPVSGPSELRNIFRYDDAPVP